MTGRPALPPAPVPHPVTTDPDVVWHYTDGPGLISILSGHCLWATSAAFLNDEQEVELGLHRLADRFADLIRAAGGPEDITEAVDPRIAGGPLPATFYILSASDSWDSLSMWRLYGGARESYAVGLDSRAPLRVLADGPAASRAEQVAAGLYLKHRDWDRVRYTPTEQDALLDAAAAGLPLRAAELKRAVEATAAEPSMSLLDNDTTGSLLRDLLDDLEQSILLIKHPGFTEEREVRKSVVLMIDPEEPAAADLEQRLVRFRTSSYGVAPYLCLTGGDGDESIAAAPSPLPVRAVAVSPSPNGPAADASVARLLRSHGYQDVPVVRSAIPFRE